MVTTNKKVNNYCKSDMTLPHKTRLHYTSIHQPDFLTLMTCSHIHTTYLTSLKVVSILSNEHIINCEYNVIFFYCDNANLHCLFFNRSVFTWCYDSSLIGYLFISGLQWFTLPPFYLKYFKIIEEGKQRKNNWFSPGCCSQLPNFSRTHHQTTSESWITLGSGTVLFNGSLSCL